MRPAWSLLFAVLPLLGAAPSAFAGDAERGLAIRAVVVGGGQVTERNVLDAVEHTVRFARGVRPLGHSGRGFAAIQRDLKVCGPDAGCLSDRLGPAGASHALLVVVNLELVPGLVALRLIDLERRAVVKVAQSPTDADRRSVDRVVSGEVRRVLAEAGWEMTGQLVVRAEPKAARIRVVGGDQKPQPADSRTTTADRTTSDTLFRLVPGRYTVIASHPGYDAAEAATVVQAAELAQVDLQLAESPSIFSRWWFWAAVGVVAVGAATTAVVVAGQTPSDIIFCTGGGSIDPATCEMSAQ